MQNVIELINVEKAICCKLDLITGEKYYCKDSEKTPGFTGVYYEDEVNFFAIYPTEKGPLMYYEGNEYPLSKNLHIKLMKQGDFRIFSIEEFNIKIKYRTSKYIDFDVWSEEKDVDLFFQIAQSYKSEEYYNKFTKQQISSK